jgi:multidrug resistance efflux pump
MVLRELVDVLRTQLAKAEARADEDRAQLQVERERSVAAERQTIELRALVDNELAELRAQINQARMTLHGQGAIAPTTTEIRHPLTQWLSRFLVQRRRPGPRRA